MLSRRESHWLTGWCCRLTLVIVALQMSERREETYRKHRIAAEATQTPAGWCWSYLVDGRVQRVSKVRLLPSGEAALLDALACARARIDELERTGWR